MQTHRTIALTETKHGALQIDKTKYEKALELLVRVACEANQRFPTYQEKLTNGVASIIGFIENREEWLKNIRRMIDDEIRNIYGSLARPKTLNGNLKERILEKMKPFLENGVYHMQFSLAGIELPETSARTEARYAAFGQPYALTSTNRTYPKLGEFLGSIGVDTAEFIDAVETLRDFLLPESDANIQATKERLTAMTTAIASAYIDFHLTAEPLTEGRRE